MCRRLRLAFVLCSLLPGFVSCAAVSQYLATGKKPGVRIVGVKPQALSLDAVTLELSVEVSNPYSSDLPLLGCDYSLESRGTPFVSGSSSMARNEGASLEPIPAQGVVVIPVRAEISFREALRVLHFARPGSLVPYRARLGLVFDAPVVGALRIPLEREGELAIPSLPTVRLGGIKLDRLALDEVRASLRLEIESDAEFPMSVSSLAYALRLGGREIVRGELADESVLGAGSVRDIAVPISFSPLKIGPATFRLLQGKEVEYRFEGDVRLQTPLGPLEARLDRSGSAPLRTAQ